MIEIDFSDGIFIYLATWVVVLLILRIRSLLRRRKNQWEINNNQLFNCDSCHYVFLTNEPVNIVRCPRCNAMCIRRTKKRHIGR